MCCGNSFEKNKQESSISTVHLNRKTEQNWGVAKDKKQIINREDEVKMGFPLRMVRGGMLE